MSTAVLLALACLPGYLAAALVTARRLYRAIRPYTEPLSCATPSWCRGRHQAACYRRWGVVDTAGEAVSYALLLGLAWPLAVLSVATWRAVTSGARVLPEELRAQVARLEDENERLRSEQAP